MRTTANLEIAVPDAVIRAVLSQDKVDEPPHSFYKYPARFSPVFAREAIKAFTRKGDTVIDPFCGGGTTLIEAIALGRRAAGFDISSLAVFLARTKTSPLSVHDKREILDWSRVIESVDQINASVSVVATEESSHYHRHLPDGPKAFFEIVIGLSRFLANHRQQRIARLALLAVGQRALDCKTDVPTWPELRAEFCQRLKALLDDQFDYLGRVAAANELPRCRVTETRRVINRSAEESGEDGRIPAGWLPAKLVLTSPPYPGVHVVYHRWQINGRKETPAPFWLVNARDSGLIPRAKHSCINLASTELTSFSTSAASGLFCWLPMVLKLFSLSP
jgi:SAM-dependent methyltransferase